MGIKERIEQIRREEEEVSRQQTDRKKRKEEREQQKNREQFSILLEFLRESGCVEILREINKEFLKGKGLLDESDFHLHAQDFSQPRPYARLKLSWGVDHDCYISASATLFEFERPETNKIGLSITGSEKLTYPCPPYNYERYRTSLEDCFAKAFLHPGSHADDRRSTPDWSIS